MSPQLPKSATTIDGAILDDKRDANISIPAQASTTPRPQLVDHSSGDGGHPGVPQAPPTASEPQVLGDSNTPNREASRGRQTGILITSPNMETKNEDDHGNPIQTEMPLPVASEHPSIDSGDGAVQSRKAIPGGPVDANFPFPTEAPTIAKEPSSMVCRDGDVGSEEVPSISMFQGSSNFQISNTNINAIGGNATIIRFGDGQFTQIQRNLICDYIANLTVLPDIKDNLRKHVLNQSIISLPRAEAVFNDYQTKKKSGPCFEGTRVALLREMADWVTGPDESRMYVLSGLAGIGKSTVAYTIASRAADLNLLVASFFFSRDEADRNNAKKFFTTIAYQLCVYNETFAKAIGDVLLTERGSAATTKDPLDQLQALILEPLRSIIRSHSRPFLIIVDALDECDEEDTFSVLAGLSQLIQDLPPLKIILTTRPQPYLDRFLVSRDGHKVFHLQDIEDKVVDSDIRLYLNYSLSLEQVQKCYPKRQWCASDEEIESLLRAVGGLFVIASTAVRYILDKSASNPAARMQKLLFASSQDHTPFEDLGHFYTIILRNVVPEKCDDHIIRRYQSVVGAIIFVQRPLPVSTLARLIDIDVVEICEVLDHLQSVILLGSDNVPRIYHKSFPDYLTDQARCKDPRLRIDARICHTQITTHCFEVMDRHLKHNILGLGNPARFMNNEDGLKEDGITDEQLQEKIPEQLCYACVYWVNHIGVANIEDGTLMDGLEKFADEHMLYWLEVLSLIAKLDSAHRDIGVVLKVLKSTSSDLHKLLSDALRFISKFYEVIKRSALHTYYSALPFTPRDSLLYHRYIKDAVHDICAIEGGPAKWDAFIASLNHGEFVNATKFSLDGTFFISCSVKYAYEADSPRRIRIHNQGKLKVWDATTGTPVSTIPGHRFAVANDFSTVASSEDKTITLCNMSGSTRSAMFTTSSNIQRLALSSESSRVAAALSDGTVWLWDTKSAKLIDNFDGFEMGRETPKYLPRLQFSPTGTRLAYSSPNGIVKLRDGVSGRFIADLHCGSSHEFEFSGDGSRIASLSPDDRLTLWSSESGALIGAVRDSDGSDRRHLAISANGSLLATADFIKVKLWSENCDHLVKVKVLTCIGISLMAFSLDNILAIAIPFGIELYDVKTHAFISTLPFLGRATAMVLSPDCSRLVVAENNGKVNLWDIQGIDTSGPPSKKPVFATALALSRDCSRLACGFVDGAVELWGTSSTKQRIGPLALRSKMEAIFFRIFRQSRHAESVDALGFDPDGTLFASGSEDRTIKLWNGGDGALRGTLKAPSHVQAVALSNSVLVAGWDGGVTLWSLDTLSPIHTFKGSDKGFNAYNVSIAENSALISVYLRPNHVTLLDVVNRTTIATFEVSYNIHTMTFLPDNSQLLAQCHNGAFLSYNLINRDITKRPTLEHLIQLPNIPLWHGVPMCHYWDTEQHCFSALFSQDKSPVPVLWIPRHIPVTAWTQGSTIIALGCKDGRIILLRLPTSHVG